jgi:hypothetical protein
MLAHTIALGLLTLSASAAYAQVWPQCEPPGVEASYGAIDLTRYVLIVTPQNACRRIAIVAPLGIVPNAATPENGSTAKLGIIDIPGYRGADGGRSPVHAVVQLDEISGAQREYLADHCKLDHRCVARWRVTLLRHDPGGKDAVAVGGAESWTLPSEIVRLDGWSD